LVIFQLTTANADSKNSTLPWLPPPWPLLEDQRWSMPSRHHYNQNQCYKFIGSSDITNQNGKTAA